MIYTIAGFVVEQEQGRFFGPFDTCNEALDFMKGEAGQSLKGPLVIRVVLGLNPIKPKAL